jgi:hypothetical protein
MMRNVQMVWLTSIGSDQDSGSRLADAYVDHGSDRIDRHYAVDSVPSRAPIQQENQASPSLTRPSTFTSGISHQIFRNPTE